MDTCEYPENAAAYGNARHARFQESSSEFERGRLVVPRTAKKIGQEVSMMCDIPTDKL